MTYWFWFFKLYQKIVTSYFTDECGKDQECVLLANCQTTRQLKVKADGETDEFVKMALIDTLQSLSCGGKLDKTVCCDKKLTGKIEFLITH